MQEFVNGFLAIVGIIAIREIWLHWCEMRMAKRRGEV